VRIINFQNLISNYDQNLLNNLRGFGKEDEYLKFWVPGTDNYQSFLNLIDALIESQIYKFVINFDKDLITSNFINQIDELLENISIFSKKNKNQFFEINLDEGKYLEFKKINKKDIENETKVEIDQTKSAKIEKNNENLISIYKGSLSRFLPNNYFIDKIEIKQNTYQEIFNQINLFFEIEKNILVKIYHDSNYKTDIEKLINIFFDTIINKNIQEAADHGVIYLEQKLRLFDNTKVNPGIILPRQAGEYFNYLNSIIRKVFNAYKLKNNIKFDINKNYFATSQNWKLLAKECKLKKIDKILDIIKKENVLVESTSIFVNNIENHHKIYLSVDKNFSNLQSKKNVLLDIETRLKTLDESLEVFIEEILDKNKLRLKNSPQSKIIPRLNFDKK
jgi:hypothetical protein